MKETQRSEAIIEWLCSHPLINYHALCKLVGYDTSNLLKAMKGLRSLPDKHLDAFERELKEYGFR